MSGIFAKVHRSKDNRLILIPLNHHGEQVTMSNALKNAGLEDGQVLELRRSKNEELAQAAQSAAPKHRAPVHAK